MDGFSSHCIAIFVRQRSGPDGPVHTQTEITIPLAALKPRVCGCHCSFPFHFMQNFSSSLLLLLQLLWHCEKQTTAPPSQTRRDFLLRQKPLDNWTGIGGRVWPRVQGSTASCLQESRKLRNLGRGLGEREESKSNFVGAKKHVFSRSHDAETLAPGRKRGIKKYWLSCAAD